MRPSSIFSSVNLQYIHLVHGIPPPLFWNSPVHPTLAKEARQVCAPAFVRPPPPIFVGHPHLISHLNSYTLHSWQQSIAKIPSNVIAQQKNWPILNVPPLIPAHPCLPMPRFPTDPSLRQEQVLVANFILPPSPLHRHLAQEWFSKSETEIQALIEEELATNSVFCLGWNAAKQKNTHLENLAIAARCYTAREPRIYHRFNQDTSYCQNKVENYTFKALYYYLWHLVEMRKRLAVISKSFPIPDQIYRGSSHFVNNLVIGEFIRFNHFTSTTTKQEVAEWYANMQKGYWAIFIFSKLTRVADLAPFSEFPNQGEYLISPDAQFQVIAITQELLYGRLGRIIFLIEAGPQVLSSKSLTIK